MHRSYHSWPAPLWHYIFPDIIYSLHYVLPSIIYLSIVDGVREVPRTLIDQVPRPQVHPGAEQEPSQLEAGREPQADQEHGEQGAGGDMGGEEEARGGAEAAARPGARLQGEEGGEA